MPRSTSALGACVVAAALTACVSQVAVPVRDGAFPRGAVQVGEDVRVTTRSGATLSFEVAGVQEGTLTGPAGERVEAGDFAALEVRRFNRRHTIIAASVIGGVVGTVLFLGLLEDDEYCTSFDDCDY